MNGETWPDGVTARYLTVGGATVDITAYPSEQATQAKCTGCDSYDTTEWSQGDWSIGSEWAEADARQWAQSHAETCRAMPKPGGAS